MRLVDAIRAEPDREGIGVIVRADDPATKVHVDVYNEFGTSTGTLPQPFLFQSALQERENYSRAIVDAVAAGLADVGLGE